MKKYLFDKIIINSETIAFISFRNLSFLEVFTTYSCGKCNSRLDQYSPWQFNPKNFKQFLQCLSRTKIRNDEYNIHSTTDAKPTFNNILREFIKNVYVNKRPESEKIEKFVKEAYGLRTKAKEDADILNKEPADYAK